MEKVTLEYNALTYTKFCKQTLIISYTCALQSHMIPAQYTIQMSSAYYACNCIHTAEKNLQKNKQIAKVSFEANIVLNFACRNDSKIFQLLLNQLLFLLQCFSMIIPPPKTLIRQLYSTCAFTLFFLKFLHLSTIPSHVFN